MNNGLLAENDTLSAPVILPYQNGWSHPMDCMTSKITETNTVEQQALFYVRLRGLVQAHNPMVLSVAMRPRKDRVVLPSTTAGPATII
jgi:hypothetical protein